MRGDRVSSHDAVYGTGKESRAHVVEIDFASISIVMALAGALKLHPVYKHTYVGIPFGTDIGFFSHLQLRAQYAAADSGSERPLGFCRHVGMKLGCRI